MAGILARSNHAIFLECFWNHVCLSYGASRFPRVHRDGPRGSSASTLSGAGKSPEGEVPQHTLQALVDSFATRLFMALPSELRSISVQKARDFPEYYSKTYSISKTMLICLDLPDDLDDSSKDYLGIAKGADLKRLYAPVLCDYVKAASQNYGSCEICQRHRFKLTRHHLIPRAMHDRLLKQGSCVKHQLNRVAWLCRGCHEFIHHRIKPHVLAQKYPSVELLLRRPDVREWAKSIRKIVRKAGWFGTSHCNILLRQKITPLQYAVEATETGPN